MAQPISAARRSWRLTPPGRSDERDPDDDDDGLLDDAILALRRGELGDVEDPEGEVLVKTEVLFAAAPRALAEDPLAPLAPGGEKLLMHASNLRKVKRVDKVVEVFARVRREESCRLVIVGEGPDRVPAERLGRELGVGEDMVFLGNQESMEELIPMAHVLLLPSEHESFGLVALEAMSCETAVVATNRAGLPELIQPGETGFLHDPADPFPSLAKGRDHLVRVAASGHGIGDRTPPVALWIGQFR